MQFNVNLIYDRINQGIKDSVDSLKDYPKELALKGGRGGLVRFLKDNSVTEKTFSTVRL